MPMKGLRRNDDAIKILAGTKKNLFSHAFKYVFKIFITYLKAFFVTSDIAFFNIVVLF